MELLGAFNLKENLLFLFQRESGAYAPLDGVRALAVLWVVCYHTFLVITDALSTPASSLLPAATRSDAHFIISGDLGVDMFFVLSGFLLTDVLFRDWMHRRLSAPMFLFRRLLRIWPLYAGVVFVYVVGGFGLSNDAVNQAACKHNWWKNLFFLNNEVAPFVTPQMGDTTVPCVGQSWSIAVEFQFYLLTPFIVLFLLSATSDEWLSAFAPLWCCCRRAHSSAAHHESLLDPATSARSATAASTDIQQLTRQPSHARFELADRLMHRWPLKVAALLGMCAISLLIQMALFISHKDVVGYDAAVFYLNQVYNRMYCRLSPYVAGILAASCYHIFDPAHAVEASPLIGDASLVAASTVRDWCLTLLALGSTTLIAYWGPGTLTIAIPSLTGPDLFSPSQIVLLFFGRVLFGFALAWLIYVSLREGKRSQWLAAFLSWRVWVPIARLSYGAYLLQFAAIGWILQWKEHISSLDFAPDISRTAAIAAGLALVACIVPVLFATAAVGFLLIERPLMLLR